MTTTPNLHTLLACLAATLVASCGGGGGSSAVSGSTVSIANSTAPTPVSPSSGPGSYPVTPPAVIAPPAGISVTSHSAASTGVVQDLGGGSLVLATDGSAWFTGMQAPNAIGRMTASGVVTYPVTGTAAAASVSAGPLALGRDGKLWFCDLAGGNALQGSIISIDPATGASVRYQPTGPIPPPPPLTTPPTPPTPTPPNGITPGSQAYAIVASADGKLWFNEYNGKRIGLFDPVLNTAIEYGPLQSRATLLAPAPDGAVWFAENLTASTSILGKIAIYPAFAQDGSPFTQTRFTEYSAQPITGNIAAMTVGPDGKVWFVRNGYGGSAIGKFDPATSAVTLYENLTGAFPQLSAIVSGPDGNLWFSDYATGLLGRITTAGLITEFSSGAGIAQFNALAAGRATDSVHRVWFTQPGENRIGQVLLP